jgi:enolase
LDPAATSFWREGRYLLERSSAGTFSTNGLIRLYGQLIEKYPIVSIEDRLAKDDWKGFRQQTAMMGDRVQIVGDDLYATYPVLIRRGIEQRASNASLIKPNRIGTVTETIRAIELCRKANWGDVIFHRPGETEDTFTADFAVAMDAGQIKAGSLSRSE